ncbi:phosphatidate phosphatase LPIN3 isoform X2 [Ischnura elegans]|uniref:phosphatidate phosphatase LPIN3 isoform X2 n=1 Tax=Ischnura elegans TaxID=197161 RepID=UPI001ED86BA1|nr:phosphatidate phosphatase LPIN3 isoform X2 [Ischnura elegans]
MNSMNYIGKFISNFKHFYNEINAATLTGAIDVVVVEQPDGSFTCSPFHVRFGKMGVLRSREKVVDIEINGEAVDIHMKLGDSGEAFFVEGVAEGEEADFPPHLACSPIPIEGYHMHQHLGGGRASYDADAGEEEKQEAIEATTPSDDVPLWTQGKIKEGEAVSGDGKESAPNPPTAQTFSAGVVEGVVVPTPEFCPINGKPESESSGGRKTEESEGSSAKVVEEESAAPAAVPIVGNSGGKRKRRRKSTMKKKAAMAAAAQALQQQQSESRNGWTKEQEEAVRERQQGTASPDGMFTMDDVDEVQEPPPTTPQAPPEKAPSAEVSRLPNDFHFFSDTEATPGCSRPNSRSGSPIRSDSEFEMRQRHSISTQTESDGDLVGVLADRAAMGATKEQRPSWKWGELPSPMPARLSISGSSSAVAADGGETGVTTAGQLGPKGISSDEDELEMAAVSKKEQEEAQRSMLGGMFSFMKRSKRMRRHRRNGTEEDTGGVYLDDLDVDRLDPEVAALYFPASFQRTPDDSRLGREEDEEEDAESGNGPSLPQSPHSVEGAIGGPKSLDSDFEDLKQSAFESKPCGDLSLSLCGGLSEFDFPNEETFSRGQVTYDDLVSNPKLLEDPALVVRMGGKFYPWRAACPIIISLLIFQKPLPPTMVDALLHEYIPNKKQPKVPEGRGYSSWFSWGRSETKKGDGKVVIQETATMIAEGSSGDLKALANGSIAEVNESQTESDQPEKPESLECSGQETGIATQTSFPGSLLDITKEMKSEGYSGSNSSDDSDGGRQGIKETHSIRINLESRRSFHETIEKYRKTLRLSSDQIESLKLKEGANEVMFSVTTAYQGTTRCKCHIYRWRYDDKIVVSDIDGTITKSDVLGHILPIVGKDWAQSGVAQLFTKIKNNGYRLLYLSARAIGQARVTRDYLKSIKQGDLSLPEGPLLLNPTSLISALHREVIEKKPEEFKISCLRDIQALFPSTYKPFYAGYGNKVNDVWAYRAVGIPIVRIFTINHKGELKHELTQTFQSSYSNMSYLVDQMFPPMPEDNSSSEDFTNFMYWRDPIPEIVAPLPNLKLTASEVTTKTATVKEEKITVQ